LVGEKRTSTINTRFTVGACKAGYRPRLLSSRTFPEIDDVRTVNIWNVKNVRNLQHPGVYPG